MPPIARRALRILAVMILGTYLLVVGMIKVKERDLVFHPAERALALPASQLALKERAITLRASDSTKLSAWIIPAARADSSGMWMLISHGNYGNIGYGGRPEFYAGMRDLGVNLLAYDYRGFGESEGVPSEKGLYLDADAAYRYLREGLGVPAGQIVIFGHSLGSGVAIDLASRHPAAALIVEGAYTSVVDRGQETYPFLPVRLIAGYRFESLDKIARVRMPKLFLHSPPDEIIPFAHGERLFAAAPEPKRFVVVKGGHMDAFKVDRGTYYGAIRELLATVSARR